MNSAMRIYGIGASVLAVAVLVSGCPSGHKDTSKEPQAAGSNAPKSTITAPPTAPPATAPVTPPAFTPATPSDTPPPPPPSEENPHPFGDYWVYTPNLHHYIGEKLQVTYKLSTAIGGKAWVGLIPESVTVTEEAANSTQAVATAPTVDAKSALLNVDTPVVGRFRLRLFESKDPGAKMLAESQVLVIAQWPLGDRAKQRPPYVTLSQSGAQGKVEVEVQSPVIAYFDLPPGYDLRGWIGVIPAGVKSPLEIDNDAVTMQGGVMYLSGKTKDSFKWNSSKPGTFVFRVFPSSAPGCDYVAQSEEFTVTPKK